MRLAPGLPSGQVRCTLSVATTVHPIRTANHKNSGYGAGDESLERRNQRDCRQPQCDRDPQPKRLTFGRIAHLHAVLIGSAIIFAPIRKRHARGMECLRDRAGERVGRSPVRAASAISSRPRSVALSLSRGVLSWCVWRGGASRGTTGSPACHCLGSATKPNDEEAGFDAPEQAPRPVSLPRLADDFTARRTAALRAVLAERPEVALAAAALSRRCRCLPQTQTGVWELVYGRRMPSARGYGNASHPSVRLTVRSFGRLSAMMVVVDHGTAQDGYKLGSAR